MFVLTIYDKGITIQTSHNRTELNVKKFMFFIHFEKSCLVEPHYLATKVPKQLIYNYTIIKAWKYKQLINKMPHQKIKNCIIVIV